MSYESLRRRVDRAEHGVKGGGECCAGCAAEAGALIEFTIEPAPNTYPRAPRRCQTCGRLLAFTINIGDAGHRAEDFAR